MIVLNEKKSVSGQTEWLEVRDSAHRMGWIRGDQIQLIRGIWPAMKRLDQVLVELALCESREKAKRAVLAGEVRINGQMAQKPSDTVRSLDVVTLTARAKCFMFFF